MRECATAESAFENSRAIVTITSASTPQIGATISGAGPTVLVWCFYEQTGVVAEALAPEVEGWANVLRVSFEPQGAFVGSL